MRALLVLVGLVVVAVIAAMMLGFINIDQTRTAQLPQVEVKGGQAPEFKAEVGRIDLGKEERTVEVPTIEVQRPGEAEPSPAAP